MSKNCGAEQEYTCSSDALIVYGFLTYETVMRFNKILCLVMEYVISHVCDRLLISELERQ